MAKCSKTRCFIISAGVLLALTGSAKILSGLGKARALAVPDPIFGERFGHLLLAVGIAEVLIALVCSFSRRETLAAAFVAWLSTGFLIYRLGLWWLGWHGPCSCLGNLTDALHISPQAADNIMKVVLAYLLIGSYSLWVWRWRGMRWSRSVLARTASVLAAAAASQASTLAAADELPSFVQSCPPTKKTDAQQPGGIARRTKKATTDRKETTTDVTFCGGRAR